MTRTPRLCDCRVCSCFSRPKATATICTNCMRGLHTVIKRESPMLCWQVSSAEGSVHLRAATVVDAMAQGRTRGLFGTLVAVQISEDEFESNTNNRGLQVERR